MLQAHSILRPLLMKYVAHSVSAAALVLVAGGAWGDDGGRKFEPAVHLLSSVPIPISALNTGTGTFSFDISYVDQSDGTYYLADRNNFAVDALFAELIVKQIFPNNGHAPFAGFTPCAIQPAGANDCAGPNGVVASFPWLFVTDAPSRVLSFDLRFNPPQTVSECTTKAGEPTRADELAYDPKDGLILAVNNAASPPFGTLITVNKTTGVLTCGTNIPYTAANGVDAQNGAEQPVWDPGTQKFYEFDPANRSEPHPWRSHSHLDHGHGGNNLPDRVLLTGRSCLEPLQRGAARQLQYNLGYERQLVDRECRQEYFYRSAPVGDFRCENRLDLSERARCGRRGRGLVQCRR